MFVPWIAKTLVVPPASLLLLAAAGWALGRRHPRLGTTLAATAWLLLALLSLPASSSALLRSLTRGPVLTPADLDAGAQAIVVLGADVDFGAAEYGGDTLGVMSLVRARYGAWLHRATALPLLVSGGPVTEGTLPVAETMARALRDEFGVPVRWVETDSRNTFENARASAVLLRTAGVGRVLLVTSAFHMTRSIEAFRGTGIEVVPAPTGLPGPLDLGPSDFVPRASALLESSLALHEWIGRAWYRVRGSRGGR